MERLPKALRVGLIAGLIVGCFISLLNLMTALTVGMAPYAGLTPHVAATASISVEVLMLAATIATMLFRLSSAMHETGSLNGAFALLAKRGPLFALFVAFYLWAIFQDRAVFQWERLMHPPEFMFKDWDAVARINIRVAALLGIIFVSHYRDDGGLKKPATYAALWVVITIMSFWATVMVLK